MMRSLHHVSLIYYGAIIDVDAASYLENAGYELWRWKDGARERVSPAHVRVGLYENWIGVVAGSI